MKVALFLALAIVSATPCVVAQTIDKTYNLNIDQKTVTKTDYKAGAVLDLPKNKKNVSVHVGVDISAAKLQAQLKNVKGQVKIKGSLDRIDRTVGKYTEEKKQQ